MTGRPWPPQGRARGASAERGQPGAMDRFVSTYTMRLDAKGRVSIPAPFRAVLAKDGAESLHCHPSLAEPALDAGGSRLLGEIEDLIARYPPYSEAREQLATALYGTSESLRIDPEGRVVLTETQKAHAGIGDHVAFVGLGHKFRMWEPERLKAHLAEATRRVRELRQAIGSQAEGPKGSPA